MPQLLNRFSLVQPELEVQISEKSARKCLQLIADDQADCGILFIYAAEFAEEEIQRLIQKHDIYIERLRQFKMAAVVNKAHPLANKKQLTLTELSKYSLAMVNTDLDSRWIVGNLKNPPELKFDFVTDNAVSMVQYLVNNSKAMTLVPDFEPLLLDYRSDVLTALPLNGANPALAYYACAAHLKEQLADYQKIIRLYFR